MEDIGKKLLSSWYETVGWILTETGWNGGTEMSSCCRIFYVNLLEGDFCEKDNIYDKNHHLLTKKVDNFWQKFDWSKNRTDT